MSWESAAAFYERVKTDPALGKRLGSLAPPEAQMVVQHELGYVFSQEEMRQVLFERHRELSDVELDAVVGGALGEPFFGDLAIVTCGL